MIYARHDAQGRERFDAADAQHQLLADARAMIAAVQAAGQFAIFRAVAFDIAIEQVQLHAADVHQPDFGQQAAVAGVDVRR